MQDVAALGLLTNEIISRYIPNQLIMAMNYGCRVEIEREGWRERGRGDLRDYDVARWCS